MIIICANCGRKEYQDSQSIFCDNCQSVIKETKKEKKIIPLWKEEK